MNKNEDLKINIGNGKNKKIMNLSKFDIKESLKVDPKENKTFGCFLINGLRGSGKTVLVKDLIQQLMSFNKIKNVPQDDSAFLEFDESDFLEMTGGSFHTLSALWGVDFYYVINSFYIDTQFALGLGYQDQKYLSRTEEVKSTDTSFLSQIDLSFGFNLARLVIAIRIEAQRIEADLQFNRGFSSSKENAGLFISKIF